MRLFEQFVNVRKTNRLPSLDGARIEPDMPGAIFEAEQVGLCQFHFR